MKKIPFLYIVVIAALLSIIGFLTLGLMMSINKHQISPKSTIVEGKKLTIIFTSDIEDACKRISAKTIGGCYINKNSLIYINTRIFPEKIAYVLTHEIGHWLTENENINLQESEKLADSFSDWVLNKKVDQENKVYFDILWYNLSL